MYNSILLFLNMGTPEIMLIMFVALLLFGGKKLPELARGLGKGIREFKDASDGVKREIHNQINTVNENLDKETFNNTQVSGTTQTSVNEESSTENTKTSH